MRGYFEFHPEYWSEISAPAKEMIQSLLVVDPKQRISASQALGCQWMQMEDEKLILRDLSKTQASIRKTLGPTEKVKMAVATVSTREVPFLFVGEMRFTDCSFSPQIIARNKFMSIAGMVNDAEERVSLFIRTTICDTSNSSTHSLFCKESVNGQH